MHRPVAYENAELVVVVDDGVNVATGIVLEPTSQIMVEAPLVPTEVERPPPQPLAHWEFDAAG